MTNNEKNVYLYTVSGDNLPDTVTTVIDGQTVTFKRAEIDIMSPFSLFPTRSPLSSSTTSVTTTSVTTGNGYFRFETNADGEIYLAPFNPEEEQ